MNSGHTREIQIKLLTSQWCCRSACLAKLEDASRPRNTQQDTDPRNLLLVGILQRAEYRVWKRADGGEFRKAHCSIELLATDTPCCCGPAMLSAPMPCCDTSGRYQILAGCLVYLLWRCAHMRSVRRFWSAPMVCLYELLCRQHCCLLRSL